jgi:uroporphyrinogen-III decarboxylase
MHQINADLTEFNLRAYDEFCQNVCVPDFMTFAEDMSYNNGPMLSKQCFDDFLAPYYRKIVPVIKERGTKALVDSDGDVTDLIPWLEEVGLEGLLPYERQAGVDVAEIRRNHPKWMMIGAYDKIVMKNGEKAMRKEFERLLPTMKKGGFIPGVDHQTPPDVSLDTYKVYVKLLKEYCEKAARK